MSTWGNFGDTRGGVGKSGVLEHKSGNIPDILSSVVKSLVLWWFDTAATLTVLSPGASLDQLLSAK